tara:strand:+ start:214 stop:537 length:324 start_codon:yes stop_codon:yes gene_type:complete
MTLNLVKGDFTELEDALRAQVQKLEEENNRLDEKIFLLDQENKLNVAELTELKTHNKLMLGMIADRDTKLITQKELINQLSGRIEELDHRHFEETPSWVSSPKPSDE